MNSPGAGQVPLKIETSSIAISLRYPAPLTPSKATYKPGFMDQYKNHTYIYIIIYDL